MTEWTPEVFLVIAVNVTLAVAICGFIPVVWKARHTLRGVARSLTDLAAGLGLALQPAPKGLKQARTSVREGRRSIAKLKRSTRLVNGVVQIGQWGIKQLRK